MGHTVVRFMVLLGLLGLTGASATGQPFVSDDFNAWNFNNSLWTFVNPGNDASVAVYGVGTSDAVLSLSVPAGSAHEPWTAGNTSVRTMQPTTDADFEIEVKFQSPLTQQYQLQGLLVENSGGTEAVRVDFNSDGENTDLFGASFTGGYGSPTVQIDEQSINASGVQPMYLRLKRTGDVWQASYSFNGTTYDTTASFSFTMSVAKVGVFAGNAVPISGGNAPAHTALVDYFFNTASPISPEDGTAPGPDVTLPLVHNVQTVAGGTAINVSWNSDERTSGVVQYGTTLTYGDSVLSAAFNHAHDVTITGLTPNTSYNLRIVAKDSSGNQTVTGNIEVMTTTVTLPVLDVWYGTPQSFGGRGVPQRRVNILGNVSDPDGLDSLYYVLNGGSLVMLSQGPDTRRLSVAGDFNADIPFSGLTVGANSVAITAVDIFGEKTTTNVTVNAASGNVWPTTYMTGWGSPTSLQDSGQVMDGKWGVVAGGVRTLEPGYDRGILIGDTTWGDYVVTAQITIHGLDSTAKAFGATSAGPAIGFLMRWKGHTNDPVFTPPINQPLSGFLPYGALGWYHWKTGFAATDSNQWEIVGNDLVERDVNRDPALRPQFDTLYNIKMLVTTIPGQGGFYRLKVWKASQTEPSTWLLNGQEPLSGPQNGSLILLVHHVDATIGKVTVTPVQADVVPPQLSNIQSIPGARSSYITWDTDEPATHKVVYGLSASYTDTMVVGGALSLSHAVPLHDLQPGLLYHFAVISTDAGNNTAQSADNLFATLAAPGATSIVTDEFNAGSLNTSLWTFVNPLGDGTQALNGNQLVLTVPGGTRHDLWTTGNEVPRIVQSANNTDFDVVVKFDNGVSQLFEFQGIIVEQDSNNLIRFDFTPIASGTRMFAASFIGGLSSPSVKVDSVILPLSSSPLYLRVKRQTDIWVEQFSTDGATWTTGAVFYEPFSMTKIGIFVGNAGAPPPAHTSFVDYFRVQGAVTVSLKAIIEGPYISTADTMRTDLRTAAVLPLAQPYNTAPWNYAGSESVGSIPAGVVDWVLVSLRTGTAAGTSVDTVAAFLRKDGMIVGLDGTSPVSLPGVSAGNYYVVVRHRNHLAIMSAAAISLSAGSSLYDFSTAQAKAYTTGADPMKAMGAKFAMYAGNGNGDGTINAIDRNLIWRVQNGTFNAYLTGDFDLSSGVNAIDRNLFWRVNNGILSQVP